MPVELDISVSDSASADEDDIPDPAQMQQWAEAACASDQPVSVSLRIVGRDEMQALNRDWRARDKPTNVLSFPMALPEAVDLKLLGDIVLCTDVIREEASAQHKSLPAHWAHMLVHGMLHLQGHDHIEPSEAAAMEQLEIGVLRRLGFDNPYLISTSTEPS